MTEKRQNTAKLQYDTFVSPSSGLSAGQPTSHRSIMREPSLDRKKKCKESELTNTIGHTENQEVPGDQAMKYKAGYRRVQFMPTEYQFNFGWKTNPSSPLIEAAQNIKERKDKTSPTQKSLQNRQGQKDESDKENRRQSKKKQDRLQKGFEKKTKTAAMQDNKPTDSTKNSVKKETKEYVTTATNTDGTTTDTKPTKSRKRSPTLPFITEYQAKYNPKYWTDKQRKAFSEQLKPREADREERSEVKELIYGRWTYPKSGNNTKTPISSNHTANTTSTTTGTATSTTGNATGTTTANKRDCNDKVITKLKEGTEYSSNYISPTQLKYVGGAWQGAPQPDIFVRSSKRVSQEDSDVPSSDHSSWYNQVLELREKADIYKERGRGSHYEMIEKLKQEDLGSSSSLSVSSVSTSGGSHDGHVIGKDDDLVVEDVECSNESVCGSDVSEERRDDIALPSCQTCNKPDIPQKHVMEDNSSDEEDLLSLLRRPFKQKELNKTMPKSSTEPLQPSTNQCHTTPLFPSTPSLKTTPTHKPVLLYGKHKPLNRTSRISRSTPPILHAPTNISPRAFPANLRPCPQPVSANPRPLPPPPQPSPILLPTCQTCGSIDPTSHQSHDVSPKCNILSPPKACPTCYYVPPPPSSNPLKPSPLLTASSTSSQQHSPNCDLCRSALTQFKSRRLPPSTATPTNKLLNPTPPIDDRPSKGTPPPVCFGQNRYPPTITHRPVDSFSLSSASLSSNCSVISDLLEKAQKRKDFWSKTAKE